MPIAGVIVGCIGKVSLSVAFASGVVVFRAATGGAIDVGVPSWFWPDVVGVDVEVVNEDLSSVAELLGFEPEDVGDAVDDSR